MTLNSISKFLPMTGIDEPSAIQQLPDGRFIIVEDEKHQPFSLVTIAPDGRVSSTPLEPCLFEAEKSFWKLDDLEGVVLDRDSGIDYTHYNLGGSGNLADYEAAYGVDIYDPRNTTTDGLFPTAKVIGGYDFVGDLWPTYGSRTEDPDPIDYEGHGTHVADIIAGHSNDGMHVGVAPGASLLGVKVCSSVSTSCNGVALLKGMDFALDPNMDGAMTDAVDVINMSLGSSYGQKEDDLSFASPNAVQAGLAVVSRKGRKHGHRQCPVRG